MGVLAPIPKVLMTDKRQERTIFSTLWGGYRKDIHPQHTQEPTHTHKHTHRGTEVILWREDKQQ